MTTPSLTVLRRQRGALKSSLTNFESFLETLRVGYNAGKEIEHELLVRLKQRYTMVLPLQDNFEAIQNKIECICDDNEVDEEYSERNAFTDRYVLAISGCNVMLKNTSSLVNENATSNDESTVKLAQNISLPAISLPKFSGNLSSWLDFKDLYESLIHNNNTINAIHKFHYLRASLENDALKSIQSLEFCAKNYNIAWDSLCNRYNNRKVLIRNHIRAIFSIEPLTKETSAGLRNIIDCLFKNLRALEQLNRSVAQWDDLLVYLITTKLDKQTDRDWDKCKGSKEFPSLDEMIDFLKERADYLETVEMKHKCNEPAKVAKKCALVASTPQCNYCKNAHLIYSCNTFLSLSVADRINFIKRNNLCLNCLCAGHTKKCKFMTCKRCKDKHNILLHVENSNEVQVPQVLHVNANEYVLLSTAIVSIADSSGKMHNCRVLLDNGSQVNFISSRLSRILKLKQYKTDLSINLLNTMQSKSASFCSVKILSKSSDFQWDLDCYVIPQITDNLPSCKINVESWNLPKNIGLADPKFNTPSSVDILLCAGIYYEILKGDSINLGSSLPKLIDTKLGWLVGGYLQNASENKQCHLSRKCELDKTLRNFWEVEEAIFPEFSAEDEICENHFVSNVSRSVEGRFIVKIPLKHPPSLLGNSKSRAIKRFLQLERKLMTNPMKDHYFKFIKEYIKLDHMSLIDPNDSNENYYLPHHGVTRQDSLTTQLRVVFDGSAVTESGFSLNDLQLTGPAIQNDMFDILIRFRQHAFVVAADITKMYRQILVHPDDRHLQNVVWRFDPNDPISVYQLNTVTYGTSSAPYLAIRCLKQLSSDNKDKFPVASKIISRDFYVDDLITGFDSVSEAVQTCTNIQSILESACFPLRKWISNNPKILDSVRDDSEPLSILSFGETEHTKTLGIQWSSRLDVLSYQISDLPVRKNISKRAILSDISKIYDPLGLLSPVVIVVKIMIQELWSLKIGWDANIPNEMYAKWIKFRNSLPLLNKFQIQRHAVCKDVNTFELHGFCDASNKAYGACIYVRSKDFNGRVQVSLLCSKTKVAPLKTLTTPRLELCSALLLANLMKKVVDALTTTQEVYYWSDSQIVLCWIQTQPKILQTFVANRVNQIQGLTNTQRWNYINTKDNPADVASRGIFPQFLIQSELWWKGPLWLSLPTLDMLQYPIEFNISVPEMKKHSLVVIENSNILLERFSSLIKLKRVLAYVMRFILNVRVVRQERQVGPLTVPEIDQSMKKLVQIAQLDSFSEEITTLKSKRNLKVKNKILKLCPFLDDDGILRVGGRLRHSNLEFSAKHPILLSSKHQLSKLILSHYHEKLLHAGPQLLLSAVRQSYWVTSGMHAAKHIVRNCVRCFRCKPTPLNALMGDLPKDRVTINQPFSVSGVDYAGPFLLKDRKGRGSKLFKGYICLFICFCTKAVHLELVSDLTTESFIAALRRFSSRRGKPNYLYSDNGTNFVGAKKELSVLYNFLKNESEFITASCSNDNISWSFIPPNSPHFGGLWESGVKSVKHHLKRVIGETHLTFEEFYTVLVQVEAILNSRPLHPLTSDTSNLNPLTPAHFLIGKPLVSVPDPNLLELPLNKLTRFQLIQQIQQSFWSRWSKEYLNHLQVRAKWKQSTASIKTGALVVVKQDNIHPLNWLLARVVDLHPGEDGHVRVVTVKTAKGTLKRSITKICPLPIVEDSTED